MKKKLLLRLCLMMCAILALSSCIHDEVYSSSDPASTEYTNKTLWEQDEKYIKNVMTVYLENEKDIRKSNGVPFWDYATTVNNFDESFLMVPVVENKRVVSVLQVPRKGSKIHFYYSKINEQISFFQGLIFAKHTKAVFSENADANKAIICSTQTIAVWLPNDENDPDPESGNGVWSPKSIVVCKEYLESCISIINEFGECDGGGGDGNDDPGYDYPGDVEEPPQLPKPKDPCAKMKAQNANADFKGKVEALDKSSVLNQKKETGFSENKNGNFTSLSASSTNSADALTITVTSNTKGYIHTHQNDYETGNTDEYGNPEIRQPIRMFSPADVNTLMTIASFINDGNYDDIYGAMVSSYGNYTIKFTGTASDVKTGFDTEQWRLDYVAYRKRNPYWSFEKLFLTFLRDEMGVQGIELFKVKSNGTVQKKTLNANNKVQSNDCP